MSPVRVPAEPQPRDLVADDGSAVTEFVLVCVLLLVLGLGIFQLGLTLWVRNAALSAASEGARLGARADAWLDVAEDRTRTLLRTNLDEAYARDVRAREDEQAGVRVVEVVVRVPVPVIGLIGPAGAMTVSGRAFSESQVGQVR